MTTNTERDTMRSVLGICAEAIRSEKLLGTGSEGCIGVWEVRNVATAGANAVAVDLAPPGLRLDKLLNGFRYSGLTCESLDLWRVAVVGTSSLMRWFFVSG